MFKNVRPPVSTILALLALASLAAANPPRPIADDQLAKIVAAAPALPHDPDLGLKKHLIDFIDCADANDGHDFLPNSWTGPDDLSVRLRLAHDGRNLYVGIEVRDQTIDPHDKATIFLSKAGYLDWRGDEVKPDFNWQLTIPASAEPKAGKSGIFTYTARRMAKGYLFEGAAPLAGLGVKGGQSIGFLLNVGDGDNGPNLFKADWARKLEFLVPHKPNFPYWSDARNCGRLALGD